MHSSLLACGSTLAIQTVKIKNPIPIDAGCLCLGNHVVYNKIWISYYNEQKLKKNHQWLPNIPKEVC